MKEAVCLSGLIEVILFESGLETKDENCLLFNARFDKDNQFLISTSYGGKEDKTEAFLLDGKYHTSKTTSINEYYITKVEKLYV